MKIGNTIFIWFRVPNLPKVTYVTRGTYMESILKKQHKNLTYYEFQDDFYTCFSINDLKKLLEYNYFRFQEYQSNDHDCEDYAYSLAGFLRGIIPAIPFGLVHVNIKNNSKHALNIFYDYKSRSFYYCEPQSNKVFKANNYEPYMVVM